MTPDTPDEDGYRRSYLVCHQLKTVIDQAEYATVCYLDIQHRSLSRSGRLIDECSAAQPKTVSGAIYERRRKFVLFVAIHLWWFSGIYGPQRLGLLNAVKRGIGRPAQPEQWSNRVHIEDCSGVLCHLIEMVNQEEIAAAVHWNRR